MEQKPFSPKLTFKDFMQVLKKGRPFLFSLVLLGGAIGFFNGIGKPLQWRSEASFREEGIAQEQGGDRGLFQMLTGSFSDDQGKAITYLTSRTFLEQLAKKENLQASLRSSSTFKQKFINVYHNIKGVYSFIKKRPYFKEKGTLPYAVEKVEYNLPEALTVMIRVQEDGCYLVKYKEKVFPCTPIGQQFVHDKFRFTLVALTPQKPVKGEFFLEFQPLHKVAKNLASQIQVEPSPLDTKLIELSVVHSNRKKAQSILNSMMTLYRDEMKRQQEIVAKEQVGYLHARLQEEQLSLENALEAYAEQMNRVVDSLGFAGTDAAYTFLAGQQSEGKKRLSSIELEMVRLEQLKTRHAPFFDRFGIEGDTPLINTLLAEIRHLKQKKESLLLSLQEEEKRVQKAQNTSSAHEKVAGITLEMADEMLAGVLKEMEEVERSLAELSFALDAIGDEKQELSSLSSILNDSLSQNVLQQYNETLFSLKDEGNRSQKEQVRLQEALKWHRSLLASHALQMQHFFQIRKALVQEKVFEGKQICFELADKQLRFKEKNLQEYLNTRIAHLAEERRILLEHLQTMQEEMKHLPKRWIAETMVQQKMEAGKRFQEKLAQLVETKNIASNLEVIRSRPIDQASFPTTPLFPRFILFTAAGSFSFALFASLILLANNSLKGGRVSEENLTASGFSVLGTFSTNSPFEELTKVRDCDLQIARKAALVIKSQKEKRSLFFGEDPHFAVATACLLEKMGKKTLLVSLFEGSFIQTDVPHYLFKGINRFNPEELLSAKFQENLKEISEGYEHILLYSSIPPSSFDAVLFSSLASTLFLHVKNAQIKEMHAYNELKQMGKRLFFTVS